MILFKCVRNTRIILRNASCIILMPSKSFAAECFIPSVKKGEDAKLQVKGLTDGQQCYGFYQHDDSSQVVAVFRSFPSERYLDDQYQRHTQSKIWRSENKSVVTVDLHNVTEEMVGIYMVICDNIAANCSFVLKTEDEQTGSITLRSQSDSNQGNTLWIVSMVFALLLSLL